MTKKAQEYRGYLLGGVFGIGLTLCIILLSGSTLAFVIGSSVGAAAAVLVWLGFKEVASERRQSGKIERRARHGAKRALRKAILSALNANRMGGRRAVRKAEYAVGGALSLARKLIWGPALMSLVMILVTLAGTSVLLNQVGLLRQQNRKLDKQIEIMGRESRWERLWNIHFPSPETDVLTTADALAQQIQGSEDGMISGLSVDSGPILVHPVPLQSLRNQFLELPSIPGRLVAAANRFDTEGFVIKPARDESIAKSHCQMRLCCIQASTSTEFGIEKSVLNSCWIEGPGANTFGGDSLLSVSFSHLDRCIVSPNNGGMLFFDVAIGEVAILQDRQSTSVEMVQSLPVALDNELAELPTRRGGTVGGGGELQGHVPLRDIRHCTARLLILEDPREWTIIDTEVQHLVLGGSYSSSALNEEQLPDLLLALLADSSRVAAVSILLDGVSIQEFQHPKGNLESIVDSRLSKVATDWAVAHRGLDFAELGW